MSTRKSVKILANGFLDNEREATVEGQNADSILLRLKSPLSLSDDVFEYIVAKVRHEGASFDDFESGERLLCNLTAVSNQHALSGNPFDLSWWRGGNATITDVIML
jgi:hypothetical protein